ncbi:MAG: diadenylate cyclase CdaA [Spirochaetales bacterium]|nr:diadenylate cyclase CdaA [Spirochaetales bacterium]MCF7937122.1 diadenylate cyclase CdaA [Spirochaetales bacterium]
MEWFTDSWIMGTIIRPVLDIAILAFLIFKMYQILVSTRAVQLLKGAVFIILIYTVAFVLNLETLLWVLNLLAPGLIIGVAIVFQPELRQIFTRIGQGEWFGKSKRPQIRHLDSIMNALEVLSGRRIGALIVITRSLGLKNILETGTRINAELTSSLLLTIFTNGTPLHDGASIIQGGRIVAAGCFLPLSDQLDFRRSFGTRHRAALGLAEESDAVVLVVSEEKGTLSLAYDSELRYDLSPGEVQQHFRRLFKYTDEPGEEAAVE